MNICVLHAGFVRCAFLRRAVTHSFSACLPTRVFFTRSSSSVNPNADAGGRSDSKHSSGSNSIAENSNQPISGTVSPHFTSHTLAHAGGSHSNRDASSTINSLFPAPVDESRISNDASETEIGGRGATADMVCLNARLFSKTTEYNQIPGAGQYCARENDLFDTDVPASQDALVFYTEDTPTSPSSAQPPHTFDEPSLATQGLGYEDVPLPDIPPLPGRPTPWLSDGEVTVYLRPLYLRGWNLVRVPRERTNSFVALEGKFYFKTDDAATEFVSEARSLMVKLSDEGTLALTASEISYRTHTTFAIPPVSSDKGTPFVAPGVTLHDIRIALMIQQIREKCEPIDGGLPLRNKKKRYKIPSVVSLGMHLLQMPTNGPRNKEEESKRGSQPRCLACGKKHVLKDCPNRDDHKPRSPCVHCGGYHWDVDCPQILPVVLKDPFSGQDHVPDASGTCL